MAKCDRYGQVVWLSAPIFVDDCCFGLKVADIILVVSKDIMGCHARREDYIRFLKYQAGVFFPGILVTAKVGFILNLTLFFEALHTRHEV